MLLPALALLAFAVAYGPDLWDRFYGPVKEYCEMHLARASDSAFAMPVVGAVAAMAIWGGILRLIFHLKSDGALNRKIRERTVTVPARLARAASRARLQAPIVCVDDESPFAFCRGFARPMVYVSTGLVELLDEEELSVVLVHEGAHAAGRHPLRALSAKLLAGTAYLLPIARAAEERYLLSLEFAADRRAAEVSLPHLASALLKLMEAPSSSSFTRAGLAINPTEERIRRLTEADHDRARGMFSGLARPLASSAASGALVVAVIGFAVPVVSSLQGCSPTVG